jgi:uncharacterized protein YndB with AHSA1/START domain
MSMKLITRASIQIQMPVEDIFEAITNPAEMTKYFISESTGRLEENKQIYWSWPEFPGHKSLINQIKIEKNKLISFVWDSDTTVNIHLEECFDKSVFVRIKEKDKLLSAENLKWLIQNTEGWANFLACLKAYLEYGIRLRNGAFDFLKLN